MQEIPNLLVSLIEKSIFLNGTEINIFEQDYEKFTGAEKVFGVSNGTDAIAAKEIVEFIATIPQCS
jgi:dTDP-4-amino-4,6-dideoxygalactose transaminase